MITVCVSVHMSLCKRKGVMADFKRGLLALISVDMGGGGQGHQSSALLVQDNPTETLNLSSASGRLYQRPAPYPPDPIIWLQARLSLCLHWGGILANWKQIQAQSEPHSQAVTSPLVITAVSCPAQSSFTRKPNRPSKMENLHFFSLAHTLVHMDMGGWRNQRSCELQV